MAWLKILFYCVMCAVIAVNAQYDKDDNDSEYNDLYESLSLMDLSSDEKNDNIVQDDFLEDFLIVNKVLDNMREQQDVYPDPTIFQNDINLFKKEDLLDKIKQQIKQRNFKRDYQFIDTSFSDNQKCDDTSIWAKCMCQFTCSHTLQCKIPCTSGCACKKGNYVFDEQTQKCVLPEQCSSGNNVDYNIYNHI